MYIEDLYERLVDVARQRIRAGELTERGLSRLCGVSQPHIHNVLKGIRTLSSDSSGRLMDALGVTLPDLLWPCGGAGSGSVKVVPMLRNRIGPGITATLAAIRGFMPFSGHLIASLVNPVAAQLAPDLGLPRLVAANDFVLLDQNPEVRSHPRGEGCWIVEEPAGLRVRYVKVGGTRLYFANEETVRDPRRWDDVPLNGRNIAEIVKARIVWIGREMEAQGS